MSDALVSVAPILEVRDHAGLDGPAGPGQLRLHAGELAFLEGESGSGKTRFLRLLVDLDPELRAEVLLAGQPTQVLSPTRLRKEMALLPQELPNHPCTGHDLLAAIRGYEVNRTSHLDLEETAEWVELFELEAHLDKKIELLSGGEKQRLALVASLVPRPRILLLDEPETGLDPRRRDNLDTFVQELLSRGMALLWVSHLDAPEQFADAPRYRITRKAL